MNRKNIVLSCVRNEALSSSLEEPNLAANLMVCEELLKQELDQEEVCKAVAEEIISKISTRWPVGSLALSLLEFLLSNGPPAFKDLAPTFCEDLKVVARLGGSEGVLARGIWHSIEELQKQQSKGDSTNGQQHQLTEETDLHIAKLLTELKIVKQKIIQADEMAGSILKTPGGVDTETRLELTEFLEQCEPRLIKLIEQGASGLLDEMTFETCLKLNDSLHTSLESLRQAVVLPTDQVPKLNEPPKAAVQNGLDDLSLLKFDEVSLSATEPPAGAPVLATTDSPWKEALAAPIQPNDTKHNNKLASTPQGMFPNTASTDASSAPGNPTRKTTLPPTSEPSPVDSKPDLASFDPFA